MTAGEAASLELPVYPFQFVDAYLYDASVKRVPNVAETDEPTLQLRALSAHIQEDERVLVITIGGSVVVPFGARNQLEISCQTSGHFRSANPIEPATADIFLPTAFVLIYPYLRAQVGELGRMTALPVPPLPTIDAEAARQLVQGLVERAGAAPSGAQEARPAKADRRRRRPRHASADA